MALKPSKRRHQLTSPDLNLTPIMNIFMIIIPFLLLTAAFSKTAIIDVYLPQENNVVSTATPEKMAGVLTINIKENGFDLGGIARKTHIPKIDGKLDFNKLQKKLIEIKKKNPEQQEVILLFNPEFSYELVIKVMDAARETTEDVNGKKVKRVLFPFASLGENP